MLYPKDGITKKEVADYYEAVSGPLLAALKDRPLAVIHWNQGIGKPGWFEQATGQKAELWMQVVDTPSAKVDSSKKPDPPARKTKTPPQTEDEPPERNAAADDKLQLRSIPG